MTRRSRGVVGRAVSRYPIFDVSTWARLRPEHAGSKRKFWLVDPQSRSWLFKRARSGTGEHWAERIAAAIAARVGIPHAMVELATRHGVHGNISLDFEPQDVAGSGRVELVLGNEILSEKLPAYERTVARPRRYTVELVLETLTSSSARVPSGFLVQDGVATCADVFVGYLMLDALIGNTDRHHENWGWRRLAPSRLELAPSFDHGSALGRELDDVSRQHRLISQDRGFTVEAYCSRGRSPFFSIDEARRGALSTREAFRRAEVMNPASAMSWLRRLEAVPHSSLDEVVESVPASAMSGAAKRFARAVLQCNRNFLLRHRATS